MLTFDTVLKLRWKICGMLGSGPVRGALGDKYAAVRNRYASSLP
jgi:hypothetical protein